MRTDRQRNTAPTRSIFPPQSIGVRWNLSGNKKTGEVPTLSVGWTRKHSLRSCEGCSLRDRACYSQNGSPAMGLQAASRADGMPKTDTALPLSYTSPAATRYGGVKRQPLSLPDVLKETPRGTRYARLTGIGEAGIFPVSFWRDTFATLAAAGMSALAYTHRWRQRPDLAPYAVASCDGGITLRATPTTDAAALTEADEAITGGYRMAAVVLTGDAWATTRRTPNGLPVVKCPAQTAELAGRTMQCRECGLCAPHARPAAAPKIVVSFHDHSPSANSIARHAKAKAAKASAAAIEV